MGKEYFSHDYNARTDPKLVKLVMKSGMDALGIYWCIIEMLYEQGGYIQLDFIDNIAFELHTQCDRITDVLKNYDLFKFEEDKFYSESVLSRLAIRDEISRINSDNAKSGWQKRRESKDVAKRSQSGRNGNKSKLKENKLKEIKDISLFWDSYHSITGLKKTDLEDAKKYWIKLTVDEQQKAIDNIKPYYDSLNDKKYCKKARTYLSDKNFNDEFGKSISTGEKLDIYGKPRPSNQYSLVKGKWTVL